MTSEPKPRSGRILRIATRESPLAMWQARHIAKLLHDLGQPTELVPLLSSGDVDMAPIDGLRQTGVFTKRIQQALLDDEADVAVHSLKDLPTEHDPRFMLAAVPVRESVHDCLLSRAGVDLASLPHAAKVGTGSTRRIAQLRSLRPDLDVMAIRGNVQTRLSKLHDGDLDAVVLAQAGLIRLELGGLPQHVFPLEHMLPAPGQGALGIETLSTEPDITATIGRLNDPVTRLAVTAERTVLAALHGGCLAPIAAHGTVRPFGGTNTLELVALVLSVDGTRRLSTHESCEVSLSKGMSDWTAAVSLGNQVADQLRREGAQAMIASARTTH